MTAYLYFNGSLRFYSELFLEMLLISALNLHIANWDSEFTSESFSAYLSIAFILLIIVGPLTVLVTLCIRPTLLRNKKFMDMSGILLIDLDPKKMEAGERALMIWPIMFFLRRAIFVALVIKIRETLWV